MKMSKKFGDRLRSIRLTAGKKQREIADQADISLRYYQKIEAGESFPGIDNLNAIASALECTVADLYIDQEHIKRLALKELAMPKINFEDDLTFDQAASLVSKFSSLSPLRKKVVLAVIYEDPSIARGVSQRLSQAVLTLVEATE